MKDKDKSVSFLKSSNRNGDSKVSLFNGVFKAK